MDSNPHTSSTTQIKNRFDKGVAAPTSSQQPPLLCSEPLPHVSKVYVKKGSCLQHMPLGRQKQQTNLCHNRKRRIVSFTQPWRCSTSNAAIPLDLSPVGETEKRLLSQTRRGQGLLIPHVICTEACSSCAVLIPCFPLTSAYSPVMPSSVHPFVSTL